MNAEAEMDPYKIQLLGKNHSRLDDMTVIHIHWSRCLLTDELINEESRHSQLNVESASVTGIYATA